MKPIKEFRFRNNVLPQIVAASIAVLLTFIVGILNLQYERQRSKEAIFNELEFNKLAIKVNLKCLKITLDGLSLSESGKNVIIKGGTYIDFQTSMYEIHMADASKTLKYIELSNIFMIYLYLKKSDSTINYIYDIYGYSKYAELSELEKKKIKDSLIRANNDLCRAETYIDSLFAGKSIDVNKKFKLVDGD
ncbi:hypothetical protein K9N50_11070 [bacterium]|nr:hypothetical protein [bacterium]